MTSWVSSVRALVVGAALLAACSSNGDSGAATTSTDAATTSESATSSSTAPERPTSTTTTAYDPAAVEGQVEAAYLKSWDVYAAAVYDLELDEAALAEVYAEEYLATVRNEITERVTEGRAALVRVEHDYTIQVVDSATAAVVDRYMNHQVLIDPDTRKPVETDPNEEIVDLVTLKLIAGHWVVTRIEELQ